MKLCNTFTLNNPQVWLRRSIVPAPSYTPITSSTILDFLHLNYKELINSTCIKTGVVFWPYLAPWSPCHRYPMEEIPEKGDNLNLFTEQPTISLLSKWAIIYWHPVCLKWSSNSTLSLAKDYFLWSYLVWDIDKTTILRCLGRNPA